MARESDLWFDKTAAISPAQKLVLDILGNRLHGNDSCSLPAVGEVWDEVLVFSRGHRVALLLYDFLKGHTEGVPLTLMDTLARMYLINAVHNQRFESELKSLAGIFADNNLSMIPLKGMVLSRFLYGDPALRPSVDLDLLVRSADLELACQLLEGRGYRSRLQVHARLKKAYGRIQHHEAFFHPLRRIHLELHHQLSPRNRAAVPPVDSIWLRARSVANGEDNYFQMSDEDQLLYLSIHSARECWGSLLQLTDIAALITVHPPDWALLLELADEQRCRRRLLISCALVARLFSIPLPSQVTTLAGGEKRLYKVCGMALQKLFNPDLTKSAFKNEHLWLDPVLADTWRDRLKILYYKSNLRWAKMSAYGPGSQELE